VPRNATTMLGWIPLPPVRLVRPSRSRQRAHPSHQPLSQSAPPARPPQDQPARPRPAQLRYEAPLYRESPLTGPQPVRASASSAAAPMAMMTPPYVRPIPWLAYLRVLVVVVIALLATGYILYEA
jgi:hypothetical protein